MKPSFFKNIFCRVKSNPWITSFIVLVGFKITLLFLGRTQLIQEHWRVTTRLAPPYIYFILPVLLLISMLLPIWYKKNTLTNYKVSTLNKGLFFVFLFTFFFFIPSIMQKNYLNLIMSTPLSFYDISSYLVSDLFFEQPYFIIYLVVLVLTWSVARKKTNDRIITTCFAVCLSFLLGSLFFKYYPGFQIENVGLMIVFFLLGIVQFFIPSFPLKIKKTATLFFTVFFIIIGFFFFTEHLSSSTIVLAFFNIIFSFFLAWSMENILLKKGSNGWLFLFWFALFFFSINHGYGRRKNIENALRLGLLFGRYFADDLFFCILILWMTQQFKKIYWIFIPLILTYLATSYVDLNYFIRSGRRLSGYLLEMGGATGHAVEMSSGYLTPLFFGIFLIITLIIIGNYIILNRKGIKKIKVFPLFLSSILLILTGTILESPDSFVHSFQWNSIAQTSFFQELNSPRIPLQTLKKGFSKVHAPLVFSSSTNTNSTLSKKNLILIILESMPNDVLPIFNAKDQTLPELSKEVNRIERYPNFFCAWPTSNHARMTIWSGLYPIHTFLTVKNPNIKQTSLSEILAEHNYFNALFYSSDKYYTHWNEYLKYRKFNLIEDAKSMGKNLPKKKKVSWGVREEVTLSKIKSFLSKQKNGRQPFFMTYVPACPHVPFDITDERFNVFNEGFRMLDGNYTGVYKNEILYMDWILSSLVSHIKKCGLLENTIIVMVSDHSEGVVLKETGIGHGWSTKPNRANISLLIWPTEKKEQGTINYTIGSQVDLLPTFLDYLDITPPDNTLFQGRSIRGEKPNNRRIYLGSYQDFSIIENNKIYWFPRGKIERQKTFLIENEGAKSFFTPTNSPNQKIIEQLRNDYLKFESLQNSLIDHYNTYSF